jgi:hypothetical protein
MRPCPTHPPMRLAALPRPTSTRASAIALTIAVHLGLFALWRLTAAPPAPAQNNGDEPAIQWIRELIRPSKPRPAPAPLPLPVPTPRKTAVPVESKPAPAKEAVAEPVPVREAEAPAEDPLFSTAPKGQSVRERAMRDIGSIDKALRKESPGGHISAPVRTPQSRLVAGIESATRAPRAWEAPRIEPVMDQGNYGRRIYKVTTALGTYCVYYDTVNTPNGQDMMKNGIKPKTMQCPRED